MVSKFSIFENSSRIKKATLPCSQSGSTYWSALPSLVMGCAPFFSSVSRRAGSKEFLQFGTLRALSGNVGEGMTQE